MNKCYNCFFKSEYRDMGASWDVCTLYKDLSDATLACENNKNCQNFIDYYEAKSIIIDYVKGK